MNDITHLADELMQYKRLSFAKNTAVVAHRMRPSHRDGALTLDDFERIFRSNKVAFLQILQLQRNVRNGAIGETFWLRKVQERSELEQIVRHSERHLGELLPLLPWKDWILGVVFSQETAKTRLYMRAVARYKKHRTEALELGV